MKCRSKRFTDIHNESTFTLIKVIKGINECKLVAKVHLLSISVKPTMIKRSCKSSVLLFNAGISNAGLFVYNSRHLLWPRNYFYQFSCVIKLTPDKITVFCLYGFVARKITIWFCGYGLFSICPHVFYRMFFVY